MGALERQVLFPTADPESAAPGWCLEASYPDGRATELFFSAAGTELGEKDLAQFFDGSIHVQGYSTDPDDIFSTAFQPKDLYPLPEVRGFISSGWRGITDRSGFAVFDSPWSQELAWASLEMGEPGTAEEPCLRGYNREPGEEEHLNKDGIRTTIRVFNDIYHSCVSLPITDHASTFNAVEKKPVDLGVPIEVTFNAEKLDLGAFRLLAYHHVLKLYKESKLRIHEIRLDGFLNDYFPINVYVFDNSFPVQPQYTPEECKSRICMSPSAGSQRWIPPTIVHHECAHHIIHAMVTSRSYGDFVDGVADAMTAFLNDEPKIGYNGKENPGELGFRLDEDTAKVPEWRGKVGRTFWKMYKYAEGNNVNIVKVKNILYRWMAERRVSRGDQIAFDPSRTLMVQLMIADESLYGDGTFLNGSPHMDLIRAGFDDNPFIRGDVDRSGGIDLTDIIAILHFLFLGGVEDKCLEAMDADNGGAINISDPISLLGFYFLGERAPEPPFPDCGPDPDNLNPSTHFGCYQTSEACRPKP